MTNICIGTGQKKSFCASLIAAYTNYVVTESQFVAVLCVQTLHIFMSLYNPLYDISILSLGVSTKQQSFD